MTKLNENHVAISRNEFTWSTIYFEHMKMQRSGRVTVTDRCSDSDVEYRKRKILKSMQFVCFY